MFICTTCGQKGNPKTVTNGSFFIELILWLFLIIPGLIYTTWRLTSRHKACPKCGNATMIPLDTPMGEELEKKFKTL